MARRKKRRPEPWERQGRGWYLELDGQQIKLGDTEDEAFREYHRIMAQRGDEEKPPARPAAAAVQSPSVIEAFDKFVSHCRVNREPETAAWYQQHLQSFLTSLGDGRHMALTDLCPQHVTDWADGHAWSASTRRGRMIAVQRAVNWSVKQNRLAVNPLVGLEKPAATRRENVVTPERFADILRQAKYRAARELLTVVWLTGCRPQEAFRVEARHFQGDRWVFPKEESKGKKKARVVFLPPEASAICERLAQRYRTGPLLRNREGNPWNALAVNSLLCRISKKIGHKYALYDLRHGLATRLLKAGVDTITTAVLLGHANTDMLARHYSHVHQDATHLQAALAKGA